MRKITICFANPRHHHQQSIVVVFRITAIISLCPPPPPHPWHSRTQADQGHGIQRPHVEWTNEKIAMTTGRSELFSLRTAPHRLGQCGPAIDEEVGYGTSPLEAELAERVCVQDCMVALVRDDQRHRICIKAIRAAGHQRVAVLGERIGEDIQLHCFLQALLPYSDVRAIGQSTSSRSFRTMFEGVRLLEPELFLECVARGLRPSKDTFGLVVLLGFERYLDPSHPYRKIITVINDCRKWDIRELSRNKMRVLAIAGVLEVSDLYALESQLMELRTPMRLTCCVGTVSRPYSLERRVQVHELHLGRRYLDLGETARLFNTDEVNGLGSNLRERGMLAALFPPEETVAAHLGAIIDQPASQHLARLAALKADAVLECCRGRTLALMTSGQCLLEVKKNIMREQTVPVYERVVPTDVDPETSVVIVATTSDLSTLARYSWDMVVLCDLPYGVACDALLSRASSVVALATEQEWRKWEETLRLHDELQLLLQRVNE
ncbi:hypothetical protein HPB50_001430 [Hyalomma asiaticum]|uniref:Uncharacterized protein n=1 Tax=Hyalomma asiaticum TaxID=266040 RepID=A0ACB7T7J7_HYAAI|nr:hypothetical protein HPB50_001430 [Hyalomma asiaticum]